MIPILQDFFNTFAKAEGYPASQAINIGLLTFSVGLIGIAASIFLYWRSRIAAMVTIAISVLGGFVIDLYPIVISVAGAFTYVHAVLAAAKVVFIVIGWRYLDRR